MKQLLAIGCAAILIGLACSGPADAWTNSKFSIGLNWSCQSGNNSLLWGAWRNGQIPEDGYGGGPGPGGPPPHGQPFPYFGSNQTQQSMPQVAQPMPSTPTMPSAMQQQNFAGANDYSNGNFYPASYQQTGYQPFYYPSYTPNYYAPNYYNQNYYTPNFNDPYAWYYQR